MINNNNHILAIQNRISGNQPIQQKKGPGKNKTVTAGNQDFATLLHQNLNEEGVKLSKHAAMRIDSRDINLTNDQMRRINDGIKEAEKKGIKDSLVLVDDIALVVSIKNKTVITAVDNQKAHNQVFTNIDGAIII